MINDVVVDYRPPSTVAFGCDAHWCATEGVAAGVVHTMLVEPASADVAAALEDDDWPRAVGSAIDALRWTAVCDALLGGYTAASSPVDVDLLIAGTDCSGAADAIRGLIVDGNTARAEAEEAAGVAAEATARLDAALPFRLPSRRTPTGYQPAVATVSEFERLRHRLGLPAFDWEAWVG